MLLPVRVSNRSDTLLASDWTDRILNQVRAILSDKSIFDYQPENVQVISGEQEGKFSTIRAIGFEYRSDSVETYTGTGVFGWLTTQYFQGNLPTGSSPTKLAAYGKSCVCICRLIA